MCWSEGWKGLALGEDSWRQRRRKIKGPAQLIDTCNKYWVRLCRSFFLSLLETCNQVILVPFFFAQNGYCSRDIVLTVELQAYRSVILKVKRELNRSHWSKFARSFLCSDYRLAKKQKPCELLCNIRLLSNISRGSRGEKRSSFFFVPFFFFFAWTVPHHNFIFFSHRLQPSTFCECNTLQPASQFF